MPLMPTLPPTARRLLAGLLLILISMPAFGQRLEDHPGYANFDIIPQAIDAEPNLEVYIKGALMRLAAEASRVEDPELADMLNKMQAVRVFGYEADLRWNADLERSMLATGRTISEALERDGWDLVARVREDDELVVVYLRDLNEIIQGMTVMVIEEDEAVFVNIVGEIDPAQIGRIGRRFNVDALDDIEIDY